MECGGKRSATPLWLETVRTNAEMLKAERQLNFPGNHPATGLGRFAALVGAVILARLRLRPQKPETRDQKPDRKLDLTAAYSLFQGF
jgi:hypothetical protein